MEVALMPHNWRTRAGVALHSAISSCAGSRINRSAHASLLRHTLGPYESLRSSVWRMGEVYKAGTRDWIAWSQSNSSLRRSDLKQRFEREAKAIAGLSHPNICTLYDVGHQDGTDYLVMEYLEAKPSRIACGKARCRSARR